MNIPAPCSWFICHHQLDGTDHMPLELCPRETLTKTEGQHRASIKNKLNLPSSIGHHFKSSHFQESIRAPSLTGLSPRCTAEIWGNSAQTYACAAVTHRKSLKIPMKQNRGKVNRDVKKQKGRERCCISTRHNWET